MENHAFSSMETAFWNAHDMVPENAHCLNGAWRVLVQEKEAPFPEGWEQYAFHDKKWPRVPLPGAISAPAALYRKSFILSQDYGTRQIMLLFQEIRGRVSLWVNGVRIGCAEGSYVPAAFNITHAVNPDRNVIAIEVSPTGEGSAPGNRKAHGFTGILGDVFLCSLPESAILDVQPRIGRTETGMPLLHISLRTAQAEGCTLRCALMDDNRVVGYGETVLNDQTAQLSIQAEDVLFWNPHHPKLYRIALILSRGSHVLHTRELPFAFCEADFTEGCFTVNGIPEKLYAAHHSPRNPESGCILPEDQLEQELRRLRASHINAIIPDIPVPDRYYQLCDRLGLYVLPPASGQATAELILSSSGIHPSIPFLTAPEGYQEHPNEKRAALQFHASIPASTGDGSLPTLLVISADSGSWEPYVSAVKEKADLIGCVFDANPSASSQLREIRALLQPISFQYHEGTLTITNHSRLHSTAGYELRCVLTRDGEPVVSQTLDLQVGPGETKTHALDTRYDIYKPGRYHLTVGYIDPETGIPAASAQWEVACLRHIFDENPGGTIREEGGSLLLRSADSAFTISRTTGALEQITLYERPVLALPGWYVFTSNPEKNAGFLLGDEWEKFSGNRRKHKPSVLEVDHMTRNVSVTYKLGAGLIQNCWLYADGSMAFELRLRTGKTAPSQLGICLPLDEKLRQLRWFGLGPDNASPEHSAGRFYGLHSQERGDARSSGMKNPVYQLSVTDESGFGLAIRSEDGLRAGLFAGENCSQLRLELISEALKPHTTYTFSFTILPIRE